MIDKGVLCNLITGQEIIEVEGATHLSSTVEMSNLSQQFECRIFFLPRLLIKSGAVIDEIQMINRYALLHDCYKLF